MPVCERPPPRESPNTLVTVPPPSIGVRSEPPQLELLPDPESRVEVGLRLGLLGPGSRFDRVRFGVVGVSDDRRRVRFTVFFFFGSALSSDAVNTAGISASVAGSCPPSSGAVELGCTGARGVSPAAAWTAAASGVPASSTVTLLEKIAIHVPLSTLPVCDRPAWRWKRRTASRVCGPKMPSSINPSACWILRTAEPSEPNFSSERGGAGRPRSSPPVPLVGAEPSRPRAAAKLGRTGVVSSAALIASDTPLRRGAVLRWIAAMRRRSRERWSERSHRSCEERSRVRRADTEGLLCLSLPTELADGLARKARATSHTGDDSPQRPRLPRPRLGPPFPSPGGEGIRLGH